MEVNINERPPRSAGVLRRMQVVPVLWHEIPGEAQGKYKKKVQLIGMEPVDATGGELLR